MGESSLERVRLSKGHIHYTTFITSSSMIQNDIPDETITILHCVSTLFTKSSPLFSVSSLANYTSPRLSPTGGVISYSSFTEVALTLETVPIRSYPSAEELSLAST